jgi:hypothetical protein
VKVRALLILACLASALTADAQATGSVAGTIRIEPDRPLVRAQIWSVVGTHVHGATTDSLGRFRVDGIPVGTITMEVICPVPVMQLMAITPVAMKREVTVVAGRAAEMSGVVSAGACEPIPARSVRGRWRGRYSSAFEESSFSPCPDDSIAREVRSYGPPLRRRAWVKFSRSAWTKPGAGELANDSVSSRGFVEWSGELHGPAVSGHMGMSNYRLVVDSIFSMSPSGSCQ